METVFAVLDFAAAVSGFDREIIAIALPAPVAMGLAALVAKL